MRTEEFQLPVSQQAVAFVRAWLPGNGRRPRGVLQIVHGMAEHGGRYARFAEAAAAQGFAIYVQDLPGHGRTARAPDELGHFADRNGWKLALQSVRCLQREAMERHSGAPAFLMGHSMGSFLLQDYLVRHAHDLRGAILSASTADPGSTRPLGLALLRAEALWRGQDHPSALAELLTFRQFNRRFRPNRTPFDWLSRDRAEVDRYIADTHCGFRCSSGLWVDLLDAIGRLGDERRAARIPKRLAVLLVAGEDDPVCGGARGPQSLEKRYRAAGLQDVRSRTWPGARHELLNETCREEVTRELIGWLSERS